MRIDLVMTFDRIESVCELWKFVHWLVTMFMMG